MLKRSDNPELFKEICAQYQKQFPKDKSVDAVLTRELTDEQLAKITTLRIDASCFSNIKSLAGIEQLQNLTEFSLNGQDQLTHWRQYDAVIKRAAVVQGYDVEKDLRYFVDEYNSGQIKDISPLYQLKHLRKLELKNQRSLQEIDFSHNPELTNIDMTNCTGLKTIKGLDALSVWSHCTVQGDNFAFFDSKFEFSGCSNLKSVEGMSSLVEKLEKNPEAGLDPHLFLPTTTYCHFAREDRETSEKLARLNRDGQSLINWTEISQSDVRVENNSAQMNMAKRYADETIRTLFHGQKVNDITKVCGIYRWVCDNITYDHKGLEASEKEDKTKKYRKTDSIRSSYVALIDKTAVCVGVSNLFNFLMADLGFSAEPCLCSSKLDKDARMTIADHQMTRIYLNDKPYYCDPTWDLGREESSFFCLTKEEMEKTHQFTVSENAAQSGMSYQLALKKLGLLKTQTQEERQ